jgi:hypothetical protein
MTTKNQEKLKGILKDITKERSENFQEALKLKADNRKAIQDLEDKGWNRAIVSDLPIEEPEPEPEPVVVKTTKPKSKPKPKADPKAAEIKKLKAELAKAEAEKAELIASKEEPEVIEEEEEIEDGE